MAHEEDVAAKRRRLGPAAAEWLGNVRTPCYVAEVAVARRNAERMRKRCESLGTALRPHVKTHKTVEGALLQTGGVRRHIAVSTLAEAAFFADANFDDILYAVPITPDKLEQAAGLTVRLEAFHVMVDSADQVDGLLARPAPSPEKRWSVVLMVDCGYGRDGVDPDAEASLELARRIAEAPSASFAGIYTHGGHSYGATSVEEVVAIAVAERDAVVRFSKRLRAAGVACAMVGVGSTPTCSNPPKDLEGVTEMHPGNYLYYDMMQVKLGSCSIGDVAVRVCTRVIGQYPERNMLLVDMGWTALSMQGAEHDYGAIDGHPELRVKKLKQEAGEVGTADGSPIDFSKHPVGSVLQILPWHSCAATHQHTATHLLEDGELRGQWKQVRGW